MPSRRQAVTSRMTLSSHYSAGTWKNCSPFQWVCLLSHYILSLSHRSLQASKSSGVTFSVSLCLFVWNSIYWVLYICHPEGCDADHIQSCDEERLRQWAAFECVLASRAPLDGVVPLGTFPILLAHLGSTADQSSGWLSACYKVWLSGITGLALPCASLSAWTSSLSHLGPHVQSPFPRLERKVSLLTLASRSHVLV